MRQAMAQSLTNKKFLFIFLRGGNDGLNTVIPHGDIDYNTTNRSNYIAPGPAHDLNGFASLHPALGDMVDGFNAGDFAAVHRVGFPLNTLSHFEDQRIWENGQPLQPGLLEGWLARYIDENLPAFDGDIPVLTVQPQPPVLVRGRQAFFNVSDPEGFFVLNSGPLQNKYATGWRAQYDELGGVETYRPLLSQTGVRLYDTLDEYQSWDQANWDPKDPVSGDSLFPVSNATNPADPQGPNGFKFSPSAYPFFVNLKIAALSLLESGSANNLTRVAGTEITGFDTHVEQGGETGTHAELLSWLGYAFKSLRIVLSGAATNEPRGYTDTWDDTVVATLSEFGRTSRTNGSFGTDHARASCMFLGGGKVNGGTYNCDPSTWPAGTMFAFGGRYVPVLTDYRAVFWEVMRDHMGAGGASVEDVFPGYGAGGLGAQELGLIQTP